MQTKKSGLKLFLTRKNIIILIACTTILVGVVVFITNSIERFLSKILKETVNKASNGLYHLDFKDIDISLIRGNIELSYVNVKLDSFVYKGMQEKKVLPKYVCTAQVEVLNINQIKFIKMYLNRAVDIESIFIHNPTVQLVRLNNSFSDRKASDNRTAYQKISKHCKYIKITEIAVQKMKLSYVNQSIKNDRENKANDLQNASIKISDLLIDSLSGDDKTRFYHTKDISATLENYQYESEDKHYLIRFDELSGSTAEKSAKLIGLRIIPKYSEKEFSALLKEQTDRYALSFEEISLNQINYPLLSTEHQFHASLLSIKGADIAIFLDRALPNSKLDRAGNFPPRMLKKFSWDTQIDTIKLNSSKISYAEYEPKSKSKGTIFFDKVSGKLENVTNNATALEKNKFCSINAAGLIMGKGKLNVDLKFDLLEPKSPFDFSGNVGEMNARALNPVLQPLALLKIAKGFVKNIKFNGKGSTDMCTGALTATYSDLRIGILEKDSLKSKLKKKVIASFFANTFVVKDDNPDNLGLRSAKFFYRRPADASFFNLIWKGIFTGLMSNIGLTKETEEDMKNYAIHMQQNKAERRMRRIHRMQRKMEKNEN